jgi:hypothetical protein
MTKESKLILIFIFDQSMYIKNILYRLVSLQSVFQYETNNIDYVLYNPDIVTQLFQSIFFFFKCACVLLLERRKYNTSVVKQVKDFSSVAIH